MKIEYIEYKKKVLIVIGDDFEAFKVDAIIKLKAGEGLTRQGGAFTPLLKSFLEEALKG